MVALFCNTPTIHRGSNSSTPSKTLVIFCFYFLTVVILLGVKYLIVVLTFISLNMSDIEHLFIYLLAIYHLCSSSSVELFFPMSLFSLFIFILVEPQLMYFLSH